MDGKKSVVFFIVAVKSFCSVPDKIRLIHRSIRTEEYYIQWVRRFILLYGKRHPNDMGAVEVETVQREGHRYRQAGNALHPAPFLRYIHVLNKSGRGVTSPLDV